MTNIHRLDVVEDKAERRVVTYTTRSGQARQDVAKTLRVFLDGVFIGRVERGVQSRDVGPATRAYVSYRYEAMGWSATPSLGHYSESTNRKGAIRDVILSNRRDDAPRVSRDVATALVENVKVVSR